MTKTLRKIGLATIMMFAVLFNADAQVGKKLIDRAKKTAQTKIEMKAQQSINKAIDKSLDKAENAVGKALNSPKTGHSTGSSDDFSGETAKIEASTEIFVNKNRGSARGDGSIEAPLKDIQKAIDNAPDGAVIRISEGNYLGNLDRGWIEMKDKYVHLEGGWNDDFTVRDPVRYITRMQPGIPQQGTVGRALLLIESTKNKFASIIVDGIFFDLGLMMEYCPADPSDPRFGCPEGCETGRIMPVGNPPNKTVRLIGGKVAGDLIIRNCMFLNASVNGIIIMTNMGGNWEIYNNVFVSNLYAACEINGGLNQQTSAHQSTVDFHHNTVLFSWPTTKEMESMGYGYRFRNGADHNVHHNLFGCNNFGALDAGWDDSNLPEANRKVLSAYENLFFMNKGDLVMAGTSGGMWLYVPAERFDEVDALTGYENNRQLPSSSTFKDVIDPAYLKGYASLEVITSQSYDANSAANLYREAHGLNKMGTSTTRVSMFGNRYNFDKALALWGAEPGYGAQKPICQ